ncbi:universal stress protein [Bizionia myxarmorum]|uniref:Universal stress protein n=1 Tax=Bizionia myxarmorum TaxID=291186 RepID=A0A5D0R0D2_9FLAO|nr:universal stress protein [Bizionia myxarmorum]TYB74311.1 universal stress protein [Bizionia myxarmorum]
MRHILLTTDFSENSIHAINYALELFTYTECEFHLLHVVKSSTFISDNLMQSKPGESLYSELIASSNTEVEKLISTLENKHHNLLHSFKPVVDYDNLVAAINQTVELNKIDLIIMGTKGATNLEKIIFGSNTLRVFQRCHVSVLAIPADCGVKRIKNVLFTTKYQSTYKLEDLGILIDLAEHYDYKLDVLHVTEKEQMDAKQKVVQEELETFFRNINHQFVFKTGANYLKTVTSYIEENDIELFSMMRKQHSFLEHLFLNHKTEQIAYNIKVPFLMLAFKD